MKRLFPLLLLCPMLLASQETTSINFANTELVNHSSNDGLIYYDLNFYPDHPEFSTDGGGLSIYSGEDGWGAIFDTNNMQWLTPNFEALKIKGKLEMETGLQIPTTNGNSKVYNRIGQNYKSENVAFTMFGDDTTDRYSFMTDYGDSGTYTERLVIMASTGNVGIGTTSPDAKLAVNGNIHAKEVKVDLTGWPDYVFKESYTPPTLEEVEKHIKEKGHLINLPSAKEVEANGVELGEMNKLLLEKIEELTLYVIELKHENERLKNLEKRIKQIERKLKHND